MVLVKTFFLKKFGHLCEHGASKWSSLTILILSKWSKVKIVNSQNGQNGQINQNDRFDLSIWSKINQNLFENCQLTKMIDHFGQLISQYGQLTNQFGH